jgi:chemotaxis protein methyltransferase CheR
MTTPRWRPEGPRLNPAERAQLLWIFREEAGLEFPQDTEYVIERKLQERLLQLNLKDFTEYIRLLRSPAGRSELDQALEEVTTHETYFFREDYQLRIFQQELLPQLKTLAEGRRRLTLWSAGCSSGEEAYTLAMLLSDAGHFDGWTLRVVGSDLSRRCIAHARRGVYGRSSFRAVSRDYESRFFAEEAGRLSVLPAIRERCLFLHANLLDQERHITLGRFEAIFCRNVLIYLAEEARERVIQLLHDRLQPGGYLLLGHSESLLHTESPFEAIHLQGDVVYRRPPEGGRSR